ncbi:MAG: bifunctional metallophosphatase/5'-nucleotidase [Chloroflexi bacterium]|nr:bifunctional metallophosphatase/5'-nucleotidase [Chloroflexota bacterium]
MRLTLLHFNDLHGRLDRLPALATLIQRARREAQAQGRAVLLLDGGDSSDRAVWESDITQGRANFALLEAMGVQASVAGNGEALQWGRAALGKLAASVHFPLLAANLLDCADPTKLAAPGLTASHVFDIADFQLGLVGVTAVYPGAYERFGYTSADPLPILKTEVAALRQQGLKTIFLLSHLGWSPPEEKAQWANPNDFTDDMAAATCPEMAVIVGSHSHRTLEQPLLAGDTLIVQAGDYGRYLGQLDLTLDLDTGRVLDHRYSLHSTDGVPPDPTIAAMLELVREEAGRLLDTRLGSLPADLPHYPDRPSPAAAWVAEALRDICRADLAILFGGFVHRALNAGPLTRRDLYHALPGSTHVSAAEVSGAQIRRMLEQMLASKYVAESFNPQRNEPPLGHPAASANARLRYDLSLSPGERLLECAVDGQPLDPARRYRLASTYFTLSDITNDPEYDFIGLEPGQAVENVRVEEVLWEIVEDWLKAIDTRSPDALRNHPHRPY